MGNIRNLFLGIRLRANRNLRRRKYAQGGAKGKLSNLFADIVLFVSEFNSYLHTRIKYLLKLWERLKTILVTNLYARRGRTAQKFVHSSMAGLAALGVMIAPVIAQEFPGETSDPWSVETTGAVLSATDTNPQTSTLISEKARAEIVEYTVQEGDTVGTIAEKFGVSENTIRWQNDITGDNIKIGQTIEVLPVTGVSHLVKKGDTVHSIAKKYDSSAQAIADFPYNTFTNDETFELAVGQQVIVPEGVIVSTSSGSTGYASRIRITPDAGTVVASGNFVWPTQGGISQGFSWYHKGIDISNRAAPNVLAADAGTVVTAGWSVYGYGNHVVVDHGNGYRTLYAHLQAIYVGVGQSVRRGDALGRMGSTGRSTGTHLHFEVISSGTYLNPLSVLQ